MNNYLKPELLILVPVLIGIGQLLKKWMKKGVKYIPFILIGVSFVLATVIGFIASRHVTIWKLVLDAVVITGLCHGLVAAFIAMGVYDTARVPGKKI